MAVLNIIMIILCCILFYVHYEVSAQRNFPVYTIVAPSKLRPNMHYHISATLHDASDSADFTIQINGIGEEGTVQNLLQTVHVEPKETKVVEFQTNDWRPGNYSLRVSGRGAITFDNETQLTFEHKSYSVFIQTDRAVYKPGQMVQFRVIVVDPYLLPAARPSTVELSVRDGHKNLIQEWRRVQTTNGVASVDFRLADGPVLGEWAVHVDIEGQKFQKAFYVAEFILPTYEVLIEVPHYVTYNKSDVIVRVKAMHSFGKPVRGEVTLTVAPRTRYNKLTVRPYESFQTKAKIDGTIEIYMNLLDDLNLRTDFFKREIEFFALIEEEQTGHKYNSTNTMWIYDKAVKVELIRTSDTFKPGLKYTAFLKVAYQDDTPVTDGRSKLELRYGYSSREVEWKTLSYTVPRNGILKLEFIPPNEDDVVFLNMRAVYLEQVYYIDRTDAAISPSNNFITVVLLTPNPKVGGTIELEVNCTETLNHLVYKVIGRGNVEIARTIPVPNQKVYRFSFRAPNAMAPKARVLVYYIRNTNNEVVADSVSFDVEGLFRNKVTVSTNVKEVLPENQVHIRLETEPNAFFGVLGIDQGILELKSGNDITQVDIIKELETYDGGQETKYNPPWFRRRKRSLYWPGSKSAGLIFADSGTVILTNALLSRAGSEDSYPESAIYIDENSLNTPFQPPSELPGAVVKEGRLVIRKKYPDTWLWINSTAGGDGTATITYDVPEDLASWIITSFSVHSTVGLAITPASSQVTVYRPFFITMSLPYVVLMGEALAIQVVVFNYNKKSIQAEVTMENKKGEFEFTAAGKDIGNIKLQNRRTKIVSIPPSDGTPVQFFIIPLKLGYIDIRVTAASSFAGDSLAKKLLVNPEGSTQNFNKAILIDFRNPSGTPMKINVSTVIPRNAIRDSGKIFLSVVGDIMGPCMEEINNLLYMPIGCGEQNLVSFVPQIISMEYLAKINKLTSTFKNRAVRALKNGYQRELTYKREDGSFSTFGERDRSGSTWLTAYAVKSLHQAEPYIVIDHDVIDKGLEWIIKQQNSQGSFEEPGEVHHKALQGGEVNGAALTSFVLMALLDNQVQDKYGREMILAQRYIERELSSSSSPYVVAIITYALHLVDSPTKDNAYQMLLNLAERKDEGLMFWRNKENEVNTTDKQSDYYFLAPSLDIETTAYGLLTFAQRFDISNGIAALKWLISKQNRNGGFSSSQDTVVALKALSEMAPLMLSLSTNINVKFSYPEGEKVFRISSSNAMELQKTEISSKTPYVEVEASGSGVGVVQVSKSFNLAVSGETPSFFLNALLDKTSTASYLQLSICTQQKNNEDSSNMAVMEVGLPSGYVADVDALPSILQIPKVKRVDTQLEDTSVVIYFDRLDKEESCVTVPAHRIHKVAHQRRASVRVYDYYSQAQSARMFYRPHQTRMCNICEDTDCGDECNKSENLEKESPYGTDSASRHHNIILTISSLTLLVIWCSH